MNVSSWARRLCPTWRALVASLWVAAAAQAAPCPLIPGEQASIEEVARAELLSEFKYDELDQALARQHKQNLASAGGDLLTLRDIVGLQQMAMREDNLMRMWADQQPTSFFAQLNAGIFYANKAFDARGNGGAANVSRNQWSNARKLSEVAQPYLHKAMALDARSALPQSALMGLAAMDSQAGGRTAAQWLQAAEQADPRSMAARINAIRYLSPRWGGSFEQLDQMLAQAGKVLPAASTTYLQYNLLLDKASHHEVIARDKAAAHALYKQARDMCDNSETARAGMVRTYP
jgi:hypothetical protein